VHGASTQNGDLQGHANIGGQHVEGSVEIGGDNPDGGGSHPVKLLAVLQCRDGAAGGHIVDDRPDGGHHRIDVDPAAGQR